MTPITLLTFTEDSDRATMFRMLTLPDLTGSHVIVFGCAILVLFSLMSLDGHVAEHFANA